ncbi:MAG TPA: hypothetical protein VK616_06950, partial [Flavitalea sp.]|nr:hypothetical protein [Flavitalea sp.]
VYQMVMEFLGYIMISQFWELQILKINGNVTEGSNGNGRLPGDPGAAASDQVKEDLSVPVKETLKKYFYLNPTERSSFDYLPFFRDIRAYFDTLNDGKGVKFFVEELEILKELSEEGQSFEQACKFLTHLHKQTMVEYLIPDNEVDHLCMVGENMLCRFFEKLGFLHRYTLTSVQKINIQKYRHNTTANFKHQVVKLMDAFGTPELNYYQMSKYLDNTGVILTKQNLELLDASRRLWVFPKGELAFLNLSAFVIDRNSFEDRADISNLMFFQQVREEGKVYTFKDVRRPDSERDCFEVPATERFEAVHLQFAAFTEMLNETT